MPSCPCFSPQPAIRHPVRSGCSLPCANPSEDVCPYVCIYIYIYIYIYYIYILYILYIYIYILYIYIYIYFYLFIYLFIYVFINRYMQLLG